jgi:hypothetical protein
MGSCVESFPRMGKSWLIGNNTRRIVTVNSNNEAYREQYLKNRYLD